MLAAIKIAYEYAAEKLSVPYLDDKIETVLRSFLYAGREEKKEYSDAEYNEISKYCHLDDKFTDMMKVESDIYKEHSNGHRIDYFILLSKDAEGKLICGIRILDSDILNFTVCLSNSAELCLNQSCILTLILDNGEVVDA